MANAWDFSSSLSATGSLPVLLTKNPTVARPCSVQVRRSAALQLSSASTRRRAGNANEDLYGALVQLAGDKALKMPTVRFRIPRALPTSPPAV